MTIKLTTVTRPRRDSGFSMIDALIAIVVLATGLLALGVLQAALTRNAADARARSLIAAYSEGLLDKLRANGYDAIGSNSGTVMTATTATCTVTASTATTCPTAITSTATSAAQTAAGVSNLQSTINVSQYAVTSSTNPAFILTTGTPSNDAGAYKQVNVTTTWTDSSGQQRTLSFDTTVSPVSVDTTNATLANTDFPSSIGNSPTVRQTNPATTLGVIPIAINTTTSTDSAATNPKPVVTNTGTTFSTYTYAPSTLNTTSNPHPGEVISKRVDTKVIQCSCKAKTDGGVVTTDPNLGSILKQPYRPSYWDGSQYTTPLASTSATTSATGVDSSATQDPACDVCCRDRNDSSSDTLKFDSFTNDYDSGQLKHYSNQNNGTLTEIYPSNQSAGKSITTFLNTCRLIRVNGSYVAATDAHNYFFGLLPTDTCANQGSAAAPTGCTSALTASDTVPSSSDETKYANFVIGYLFGSRTSLAAGTGPGILSDATTLYNAQNLNLPSNITISLPNSVSRWLYARGLYIDHLESASTAGISAAQEALNTAITNCGKNPSDQQLQNCILPVLPFTTINMTELATWSTTPPPPTPTVINVSNLAVIGGDETSPKRGNVTVPSTQNGSGSPSAYAVANTFVTNSGLTGVTINQANSPYDVTNQVTDQKQFTVTGTSSGGGGTVYFDVNLKGLSWMSNISNVSLDPTVAWSGTAAQLGTAASGSSVGYLSGTAGAYSVNYVGSITTTGNGKNQTTTVLPNAVNTSITPAGLSLSVQKFNNYDNLGTATVTCTAASGGSPATVTVTTATRCYNYQVNASGILIDGAAVSGATATLLSGTIDGGMNEGAFITVPSTPGISSTTNTTAGANNISVPFTLQNTTTLTGTCVCSSKNNCATRYSYTPGVCSN